MKVSNKTTMIQLDAYLKQARQQQVNSENQPSAMQAAADKVDLSDKAREAGLVSQMPRELQGGRAKEVRQVKAAVDDGTYRVDSPRVAGAMLRESFENDMILKKIDMRV